MFINKLNQVYKPERVLYYTEATEKEISNLYAGEADERFASFSNAFGTYDYVGVYYIKSLEAPVIGIEYRMDDEKIDYPTGLKSIVLNEAFFYSIEIENEVEVNIDLIHNVFKMVAKDDDAHRTCSDLSIKEEPEVISVIPSNNKYRMLYEWKVDEDRAKRVINDDYDSFEKNFLYKMAFFDPITGHYNWNHLVPFLESPCDYGIKDYAFVHFDIKEFRVINEIYGHIAANKVLCNVVKAMNESEYVYTSARCHEDNFAMMIKDMSEEKTIEWLKEFFESISHLEEDPNYKIFYRAGVVPMKRSLLSGNRVADAGKMVQNLGVNRNVTDIIVYSDKMHDDIVWGTFIKAYIDTAVENDEFLVYLQPKFDIQSEKIKGAEALIRWNYKNKEFLAPYRFIPFFEKDGSIGKIDDIVLEKVCEALDKWKKEDKPLYPVSVNLSRERLYDSHLVEHLTDIIDSYNVDHSLIDFELTESASYDDTDQMIKVLSALRERGFKISMDDFGTGYSSFSLLTQMPLDTLKIDKSFVDKIGSESDKDGDIKVIRHIIELAKDLKLTCLAEGAEDKNQVDKLRTLGCEVIQGYYYSKPIPLEDYDKKYLQEEE